MSNTQGYRDIPVRSMNEDTFGISDYIESLCDFVLTCDTPLTIAIQGDWGTGKTSILNMMQSNMENKVESILFNTWQYSQFGQENTLAISLLNNLSNKLNSDKGMAKFAKNVLMVGKGVLGGVLRAASEQVIGDGNTENLSSCMTLSSADSAAGIEELKNDFAEAINSKLLKHGKDRIVIYVDDLDRLQPARAVELLEVMKNFLDVPKCIFILAIDYNVVVKGVKSKYGEQIGEEKGRSFFDKIIQLPFQVPVSHYKIDDYIKSMLSKIDMPEGSDDCKIYKSLIEESIGINPRGIKRIFNSFALAKILVSRRKEILETVNNSHFYRNLFAVLCMQSRFPRLYEFFTATESEDELRNSINELKEEATAKPKIWQALIDCYNKHNEEINDSEKRRLQDFMSQFYSAVDTNGKDNILSTQELQVLRNALNLSNVVSTGGNKSDKHKRITKSVKKEFFDKLLDSCNDQQFKYKFEYDEDNVNVYSPWSKESSYYYSVDNGINVGCCFTFKNKDIRNLKLIKMKDWYKENINKININLDIYEGDTTKELVISCSIGEEKINDSSKWPEQTAKLIENMKILQSVLEPAFESLCIREN